MEILNDFDTNIRRAFNEIDSSWESYNGLVVAGTHTPKDWERIVLKLKEARENSKPALGICFGLQMMLVEFFRNVIGWEDAQSTEIQLTKHPVVAKLPEMRVGIFPVGDRMESHWHNYAANPHWTGELLSLYWDVVRTGNIVEEIRLKDKPCIGTQYHPEYQSSKEKPHPILAEFINLCKDEK